MINISFPAVLSVRQFRLIFLFSLSILFVGCSSGDSSEEPPAQNSNDISLRIAAPVEFDDEFCTRVEVTSANFSPIVVDQVLPAGTPFIETVVPNIPQANDVQVELGIFANGVCATPETGDWYGIATDVSVLTDEVTLVSMVLTLQNATPGTGTIIIRDDGVVASGRSLHGEVVSSDNTPLPGVSCRVFEDTTLIGTVQSGETSIDLGVLNTSVEVDRSTGELNLVCFKPGFSNTEVSAILNLDPGNPQFGVFTATVEMRRGVAQENLNSSPGGLSMRLHVPPISLTKVSTQFGEFDQIQNTDDAFSVAAGGMENLSHPEVPVHTIYFAVPAGERLASVRVNTEADVNTVAARLYPVQPPRYDRAGFKEGSPSPVVDEPFSFDLKSYLGGSVRISDHDTDIAESGSSGVNIYQIRVPLVDFDSSKQVLTQYSSLKVELDFTGTQNQTCFQINKVADGLEPDGVDKMLSREGFSLRNIVANKSMLSRFSCNFGFIPVFFGAKLVIVSHPDFLSAANDLKQHKISRGISTQVVNTNSIPGQLTAAGLKAYLRNIRDTWFIKPQWVLFMGDSEFIPTYYDSLKNSGDEAYNAGDMYYGQLNGNILSMPVFGIGRLPVDTLTEAQQAVDKIVAFENNPPGSSFVDNPYYSKVSFAAEFQDNGQGDCCTALDGRAERWFAETSEKIRTRLLWQGISVDRVYTTDPPEAIPTTYRDGNPVPGNLRKPGFPWDGDRFDVINAVNDGRSIVYHRDHGWWWGWGTPRLTTFDLDSMSVSNNEFPVVYSINCASGIFDNETVDLPANRFGDGYGPSPFAQYWGEKFVLKPDGAIAVIGDTRSSSTVANNDFAEGLFDATWPQNLAFGSNQVIRKVGDVLNHAKGYIKSRGYSDNATRQENLIYNVLGDPTIEVRTRKPKQIKIIAVLPERQRLTVGIECESCPTLMNPLVVVAQDLKGNEVARGLADYNGQSFEISLDTKGFDDGLIITASGYDVLTSRTEYK